MNKDRFIEYLAKSSPINSRKPTSYAKAVQIVDEIFMVEDVFGLNGTSLFELVDVHLLMQIQEFVKGEEKKMQKNVDGIFVHGRSTQTSYPLKGFCSAAISNLVDFVMEKQADELIASDSSPLVISKKLTKYFDLKKDGTDELAITKRRVGQSYFRKMILVNYENSCCITGLNVPSVLQASHIDDWSKSIQNRMNPTNGICLSATYHEAFDAHLFSLDEDYRLILSKQIRDYFTVQVTRDYFEKFEGTRITLPVQFQPSQELLAKHRKLLVG